MSLLSFRKQHILTYSYRFLVVIGLAALHMSLLVVVGPATMTLAYPQLQQQQQPPLQHPFEHSEPTHNHECRDAWQWMCEDGMECIAQYDVCDGVAQCADRSDEKNCQNRFPAEGFQHQRQPYSNAQQQPQKLTAAATTVKPATTIAPIVLNSHDSLQMSYVLAAMTVFVVVAGVVHTVLKRRKRVMQGGARGFRRGESLVEDEDDLLISQMYT